jgi:hypothetical protein
MLNEIPKKPGKSKGQTDKQGCGSASISCGSGYGSGSSIFSYYGSGSRSQCGSGSSSRIQSFDDQKLKKKNLQLEICFIFFDQKLQFYYPPASVKDALSTGEAFSSQKRTPSTSKREHSLLFFIFVGNFYPPGFGSGSSNSNNADPSGSGSTTLLTRQTAN